MFKVSKLELLTPWIRLALFSTFAVTITAVFVKFSNCQKKYGRKKKHDHKKKLVYGLVAILFIILISYIFCYSLPLSNTNVPQTFQFKAAIIDHLSFTQPNQTFIQGATDILKKAGYTVDYYSGEEVSVDFYRNLPTYGYSLIVLRVHSALAANMTPPLGLFTSEPYSTTKYFYEQLTDQLAIALFPPYNEGDPLYFSVLPSFVKYSMNGRFQNTTVIMMGCDGLTYTYMAEAFVKKGAKAYISWNGPVSASHTDQATMRLLEHLITEKQTIREAVTETMKEAGPDPVYESVLAYHPVEAEKFIILKSSGTLIMNAAEINVVAFKNEGRYRIR